jgi:hypothetical protein
VSKQNKKEQKKLRWLVGKPWEKVEIIDEKTGWAITKNRNSFSSLGAGSNLRTVDTHTQTLPMDV